MSPDGLLCFFREWKTFPARRKNNMPSAICQGEERERRIDLNFSGNCVSNVP